MKRLHRLISMALLLIVSMASIAAGHQNFIGVARDTDSEVQYIEHHQYLDSGEHRINYYSPELTLLVQKKLSYPGLPHHPNVVQSDLLNDIEITMQSQTNTLSVKREQDQETNSWDFELTPNVIVDAGFDGYIRNAWAELSPGMTKTLKFAVAGQDRLIQMKISDMGYERDHRVFVIEPKNWLIRMIIPQIRLEYSNQKQLVRYEGLSNIRASKGGNTGVVDIRFKRWDGGLSQLASDITREKLVTRL